MAEELRRFFAVGDALPAIQSCLENASVVRIATAFFEPGGWELLSTVLAGKDVRILVGRSSAHAAVETILNEFFAEVEKGILQKRHETLSQILNALRQKKLLVKISASETHSLLDIRYTHHHAKLYIADKNQLVVTSANFTTSGLILSREAGYLVTQPDDVAYFVEKFDSYFEQSLSLNETLLDALEQLLELRSPEEVYLRTLLEIYGTAGETASGELPSPARYQEPIIARIVRTLAELRGAFLVASTGLGKTVIAAHAVARLRQMGLINAVIVIAPAGLREMWHDAMRKARVSSREYSYTILSHEDWLKYHQVFMLENELRGDLQNMLIILDESHHMRNAEEEKDKLRLRNQRIQKAVERGCYILLLTATPYSRSVDDINNQLCLLPQAQIVGTLLESVGHYQVARPTELSELAVATVMTAPTVVRHFSQTDEQGERYIVFGHDQRMYFPRRLHLRTIEYHNPANHIYLELVEKGLLARRTENGNALLFAESPQGERDHLFEARLIHQFCSSLCEVKAVLDKLSREGGYEKMRFQNQEELGKHAKLFLRQIHNTKEDKFEKLCQILERYQNEKVVIFCIYQNTAHDLCQKLKARFPQRNIETTVDKDDDRLEIILKLFSPIANGFAQDRMPDARPIDWLVATEAIAEGFNLQDARILINYDLPWAVLQLAQRMGRLLRPWHEVRELFIYNFVPDTMSDPKLKHALCWRSRLDQRSREHASFANLPVLLPKRSENEMALSLFDLGDALRSFASADLEYGEAIDFVTRATELKTSSVLDDLAEISPQRQSELLALRPGFRSRVRALPKNGAALFLLLQRKGKGPFYPAAFTARGGLLFPPHDLKGPLELLRTCRNEPIYTENFDPTAFDQLCEKCRLKWAEEFGADPAEVRTICALAWA